MNSLPRKPFAQRSAIALWVIVLTAFFARMALAEETAKKRPNILYIMTDQQQADMMSCAGNQYLKTPAMDSLAANGCRFEQAYAANPVCLPSRVTRMTGHYPSRFGIRSNTDGRKGIDEKALHATMGWIFRKAGYETVFGGKTHWPRGMTPKSIGFENLTSSQRDQLAEKCAEFLRQKHDRPFLLVASFINPHDICYMAIDDHAQSKQDKPLYPKSHVARQRLAEALAIPEGVSREDFFAQLCPPLPENFEIPSNEPERITDYLAERPFKKFARQSWSVERWRQHRWAYCRLTERVDTQVGIVLNALRKAGLEENTLVVLSSDHGDMDSAHRMEHKSVLYEESCRVPMIVSYLGVTRPGLVDRSHLVSAGIDLLPTLCDYAKIEPPAGLPGRSVRPIAEGIEPDTWRDALVVESEVGRMLRTARYKYNFHDRGANHEQLIDLETDPGEMVNLAENPEYTDILTDHRHRLRRWIEQYGKK